MPYQPIELQILALLQAKRAITVRWDCGGDESFVYTALDGVEQQANYNVPGDFAQGMDYYLTDLLGLPSVGEFEMDGTGRIFQEGSEVVIDYQSQATTYWDDESDDWMEDFSDEQLAEMGYERTMTDEQLADYTAEKPTGGSQPPTTEPAGEQEREIDPEMSAEYTGRLVLFRVE